MTFVQRIKYSKFGEMFLQEGPFAEFARKTYRKLRALYYSSAKKLNGEDDRDLVKTLRKHLQRAGNDCAVPSDTGLLPTNIIVPVFNGYEYLEKLTFGLLSNDIPLNVYFIDDKSTDERVFGLLEDISREYENVFLIKNESNMGFVHSVNRGIEACKESPGHIVIVNTDVELPQNWLYRLIKPILDDAKIASVTPFSNSANIFSFPDFGINNVIYRGLNVDTLDSYFSKVHPVFAVAPTGMGFCMAMNRAVIDKIGLFDEKTFGKGYGEENDWCQRAEKAGFKNVSAENLFVYHKHGGSFKDEEKRRLIETNTEILKKRYPGYDNKVYKYVSKETNGSIRKLVQMIIDTCELKSYLYIDHMNGGGANEYTERKRKEAIGAGEAFSVIRYNYKTLKYHFEFDSDMCHFLYTFEKKEDLLQIGEYLKFDEIYVNEVVTYPDFMEFLDVILKLKEQQNAGLYMLLHDYFCGCPSVSFAKADGKYCGQPDCGDLSCLSCYKEQGFDKEYNCASRADWVSFWEKFLLNCEGVIAFSNDTLNRVKRIFPSLNYKLISHQVNYLPYVRKTFKTRDKLQIGLLGLLGDRKGSGVVRGLLSCIEKDNLPVEICLIGECFPELKDIPKNKAFRQTGRYQVTELPRISYEEDIDIFIIPSLCPETFCYTAEEVMKMGFPVAVFNIGAPVERVKNYDRGLILSSFHAGMAMEEILRFSKEKCHIDYEAKANSEEVLFVIEKESFASRYRVEHFKEALGFKGIKGRIVNVKDIVPDGMSFENVKAIVIYRSEYTDGLARFMDLAREARVKIYYDIDDYIFDFEKIKDLSFIKDREYKDFDKHCDGIRKCMEKADAITVSTEHLKKAATEIFHGKEVLVNRNVAGAQMLGLSLKALESKHKNKGKVWIGYFSGSGTHNRDFSLIKDVLYRFLKEHEEVHLLLMGALKVPEELLSISERVKILPFMDWRELPEIIARCDINLMPLEYNFFNKCKSENKWMEAGLVKVATIASYNEELAMVTKDGEDIVLCKNEEEWEAGLNKLLDKDFRDSIAEAAYRSVVEGHTTMTAKFDCG